MKINFLNVIIFVVLLTSCTPKMPAQEIEVTTDVPAEVSFPQVTMTQELVVTIEPTATRTPTITPTKMPSITPPGCVTLLTPLDGAELPAMGKVTFSWEPMTGVSSYVLNIILPSGATVSFEMTQTSRDQYIEAFSPEGDYQWNVTVIGQDRKRTELCRSELATFSKPASTLPPQTDDDGNKRK